jgi:general secretion pathway protein K
MTQYSRGFALIIVLWGLILLSIAVAAFTSDARTEMRLARNQVESAAARSIAEAGIATAINRLLDASQGERWRVDGFAYQLPFAGGSVEVSIQDESGKVDINAAPEGLLEACLRSVGLDASRSTVLAREIVAFRGASTASAAGGGAPPEGFSSLPQLMRLPGVDRSTYERIEPWLTVHSRRQQVNPMTAPPAVLAGIPGMTPADLTTILAARARPLDRDQLIDAMTAIGAARYGSLSPARTFTVRATAQSENGAAFVREAIVFLPRRRAPPFVISAWRQGH